MVVKMVGGRWGSFGERFGKAMEQARKGMANELGTNRIKKYFCGHF
jgi:hypothetical protein